MPNVMNFDVMKFEVGQVVRLGTDSDLYKIVQINSTYTYPDKLISFKNLRTGVTGKAICSQYTVAEQIELDYLQKLIYC